MNYPIHCLTPNHRLQSARMYLNKYRYRNEIVTGSQLERLMYIIIIIIIYIYIYIYIYIICIYTQRDLDLQTLNRQQIDGQIYKQKQRGLFIQSGGLVGRCYEWAACLLVNQIPEVNYIQRYYPMNAKTQINRQKD